MTEKNNTTKEAPKASEEKTAKPQLEIKTVVGTIKADPDAGTYKLSVEVSVFMGGRPLSNRQVEVREKLRVVTNGLTDNRGVLVLKIAGELKDKATDKQFRICLIGTTEEVIITAVVPGKHQVAGSNDPESLSIYRYHDKQGNFRILVRILKAKGAGLIAPFSIWFKGQRTDYETDKNGLFSFPVSPVCEGDDEQLLAFANGIEEKAKLRIYYPKRKENFRNKPNWIISTNNGRALIFMAVVIIFWLGIFFSIDSPVISPDLFRDSETGLSAAEKFYNESAKIADSTVMIRPREISGSISDNLWILGSVFSVIAIFYFILSWREEVLEGIEMGLEKIIDRNSDRADDPVIEKWMKHFGMMSQVGSAKITGVSNSTTPVQESGSGGHPSLGTLFKLDLMSDILVEIMPAIFKKIFGK